MTAHCPHCLRRYEGTSALTGDQVLCSGCGAWLHVRWLDGGRLELTPARGGWSNPASAENGRKGGRPQVKAVLRKGEIVTVEKGGAIQAGVVKRAGSDAVTIEAGGEEITIRRQQTK